MKRIALLLLLTVAPGISAQTPSDTEGGAQAGWLRQQIRQRWNERVRRQLGLTEDQTVRLHATEDRFFQRRREILWRQRAVLQELHRHLQAGSDADPDSVRALMDEREQNRVAIVQLEREEDQEMAAYLTPVQRARYQLMRQRLQERIAEMRQRRGRR